MDNLIKPPDLWRQMLQDKHLLKLDYGFTIPFLVGAYYTCGLLKNADLQTSYCIRFVLDSVLTSVSEENPIKIIDCPDVNQEFVFQYLTTGLTDDDIADVKNTFDNIDCKIYWHYNENIPRNLDSFIDFLWTKPSKRSGERYAEIIASHRFSCYKGVWQEFNQKELDFIKHCKIYKHL